MSVLIATNLLYYTVAEFTSEFPAFSTKFGRTTLGQYPEEPLSKGTLLRCVRLLKCGWNRRVSAMAKLTNCTLNNHIGKVERRDDQQRDKQQQQDRFKNQKIDEITMIFPMPGDALTAAFNQPRDARQQKHQGDEQKFGCTCHHHDGDEAKRDDKKQCRKICGIKERTIRCPAQMLQKAIDNQRKRRQQKK